MRLRPYSASPPRLALQVLADVAVLAWIYLWYRLASLVHDTLLNVAATGYTVDQNAGQVAGNLSRAGQSVGSVPLFGEQLGQQLGAPLTRAGQQVSGIALAGRNVGDQLTAAATPIAWIVALGPILLLIAVWLPARLRFARRAGATAELAAAPAGIQLLALRALTSRPLHELTRISPDPVQAWQTDDPDAVRALARLELDAAGVRPPRIPPGVARQVGRARNP